MAYASGRKQRTRTSAARGIIPASLYIKGVHKFKRTTTFNLTYTPSTGLSGSGNGIALSFSLNNIYYSINAGGLGTQACPDASQLSALFDQFRIDKVIVKVFFTDNSSSTASSTTCLPIVTICNDYQNTKDSSQASILANTTAYTKQIGQPNAGGTGGIFHKCVPRCHLASSESTGFGAGTGGSRPEKPWTWVDTAQGNTDHFGVKMYFDAASSGSATQEASVAFYVDTYFSFRDCV